MQYFPRRFTRDESSLFIDENARSITDQGWGAWAVETINDAEFIGFVGFSNPADWHPCAGEIDIGWRLHRSYWGCGYATEAALKALEFGFEVVGFKEVVSFTSKCNLPSVSVMRKIGMRRDPVDFEHPRIDTSNRLCLHVLYRLNSVEWRKERQN